MKSYKNLIIFIKEIFSDDWAYGNKTLFLSQFICFILIAYYNLSNGYVMSPDSNSYSEWADKLIDLNFNLYNYYLQNTFINPNYLYTTPVLIIAFIKLLFGADWQYFFMYFNLSLVFFSIFIFSKSLILLNVRPLIISLTLSLIILSVDLLTWPRYMLTDMIFSFLILLLIYVIIKNIIEKKFSYLFILFLIILIYLTRPTSIPYIFAILTFIGLSKVKIEFSKKFILTSILAVIAFTPFFFSTIYYSMKIFLSEIPQTLFLTEMVEQGMIIHDRPETWIKFSNTFLNVSYLYFLRFIYFFNPYSESFSKIHIILNIFQTLVIFCSLSVFAFLKTEIKSMHKCTLLIVMISLSVAFFHSFTLIDFDWRYRFPIIIPMLMIVPLAFEIILRKFKY